MKVVTTATPGLNARLTAGGPVLITLPPGTLLDTIDGVEQIIDGRTWQPVTAIVQVGSFASPRKVWVAKEFLHPVEEPPPITGVGHRRFGLNGVGPGALHGTLRLAERLSAIGIADAPFRVTNEAAVAEVLSGMTTGPVVFRVVGAQGDLSPRDFEGRAWTGAEWFARWYPALATAGERAVLEFVNEKWTAENADWWSKFYLDLAIAARKMRRTITLGNFNVGAFNDSNATLIDPIVKAAIDYGHIVSGNTYRYTDLSFSEANNVFRYLSNAMKRFPAARWMVGELGWASTTRNEVYQGGFELQLLLSQAATTHKQPGFLGFCLWVDTALAAWSDANIPEADYHHILNASRGPTGALAPKHAGS